jgi:hypothetical protein
MRDLASTYHKKAFAMIGGVQSPAEAFRSSEQHSEQQRRWLDTAAFHSNSADLNATTR